MEVQKFCPRCGKKAVKQETDTELAFHCPDHGLVWKEQKAAPEPADKEPEAEPQAEAGEAATGLEAPKARALN